MKKHLLLFLAMGILFTSCDNDDNFNDEVPVDFATQNFMWQAMNFWYFWQGSVENLADDRFDNVPTSQDYLDFLATESNPADFIVNQLQSPEDRFTFFSDNFVELTQSLAGVSRSNGVEFQLVRFGDGDDVFGIVRYIIPNSDASTKNIQRGDLFTKVDGVQLFSEIGNSSNNNLDLLFGDNVTFTLTLAEIVNNTVTETGEEVSLTKMEGLSENPVFLDKIFDIGGTKIGYVVYNGFTNEYDEELNEAFGRLKADNATELILDLRYNSGGSVNSSRLLSSMIFGTNTNDLYLRQRWNEKQQARLSESQLVDNFASVTNAGTPINTLNLDRVYIITTNSTASSSELVINGLAPYMDIIQIGETTSGKNEFSITLVDDPENDYIFSSRREENINPNNQWAIQPLVGRNENADGFFEYTDGLFPDIELEEDLANLGTFGDENEPLLARALQEITGVTAKSTNLTTKLPYTKVTNSRMFTPMKDNMYLDTPSFMENYK